MPVVPRGFDEHAPQMRIARFGDRAVDAFGTAGVLRGDQAGKRHEARRRGKASGVAEFGGNGERGEVVDPAEAAQAFDTRAQRLDREQIAQLEIDGLEARDGF